MDVNHVVRSRIKGTQMNQDRAPVTKSILDAKIKSQTWTTHQERAKMTYANHQSPLAIERSWPQPVRRLYQRLRTGHAKELRYYRWKIGIEKGKLCTICDLGRDETIEHVMCECPALAYWRTFYSKNPVSIEMLVDEPEVCRSILAKRYPGLRISHKNSYTPESKEEEQQQ